VIGYFKQIKTEEILEIGSGIYLFVVLTLSYTYCVHTTAAKLPILKEINFLSY
jgi:hypothetical protein